MAIGRLTLAALLLAVAAGGAATTHGVTAKDNRFAPGVVTVGVGDTVVWTNREPDVQSHTVTADDGSFDSHPACLPLCLAPEQSFSHTFKKPGTFRYHCKLHGGRGGAGMAGTVVVTQAAAHPPAVGSAGAPGSDAGTPAHGAPLPPETAPPAAGGARRASLRVSSGTMLVEEPLVIPESVVAPAADAAAPEVAHAAPQVAVAPPASSASTTPAAQPQAVLPVVTPLVTHERAPPLIVAVFLLLLAAGGHACWRAAKSGQRTRRHDRRAPRAASRTGVTPSAAG